MSQTTAVTTTVTLYSSATVQLVGYNEGRRHLIVGTHGSNGVGKYWVGPSTDPSTDGVYVDGILEIPEHACRAALNAVAWPGGSGGSFDVITMEFVVA